MQFRIFYEAQESPILAHVAGPAGVGKTTLMNRIKRDFPQILVLDLDKLDDLGTRKSNFPQNWKFSGAWTPEKMAQSHGFRQVGLDKFVYNAQRMGKKVVLFGIYLEADTEYKFDTPNRILITRPINDIVRDRIARDTSWIKSMGMDYEKETQDYRRQAEEEINLLKQHGYREMSIDQAYNYIAQLITQP